jgi:hypothetical protein
MLRRGALPESAPSDIDDDGNFVIAPVSSPDGAYRAQTQTGEGRGNRSILVTRPDNTVALRLARQQTPAFSHRGGLLATVADGIDSSVVHLWEMATGRVQPPAAVGQSTTVPPRKITLDAAQVALDQGASFGDDLAAISPDGRTAAVAVGPHGQHVALWRLAGDAAGSNGQDATRMTEFDAEQIASADFSRALESLAFSSDSRLLVTGGSDGTVKIWTLEGKLVRRFVADDQEINARFSPDGSLLVTWSRDGVKLWTVEGELLDTLKTEGASRVWFDADGRWVVAAFGGRAREAWSLDLAQLLQAGCVSLRHYLRNSATTGDRDPCGPQ